MKFYYQIDDFIIEEKKYPNASNPRREKNLGTFYLWSDVLWSPNPCPIFKNTFKNTYNDKNSIILSVYIDEFNEKTKECNYTYREYFGPNADGYIFVSRDIVEERYGKINDKTIASASH